MGLREYKWPIKGYWFISRLNLDTMYALPITEIGIAAPVKSYIKIPGVKETNLMLPLLRASNKGDMLAEVIYMNDEGEKINSSYLSLYTFDKETGITGKRQIIASHDTIIYRPLYKFQSLAFSPNDSFFYVNA